MSLLYICDNCGTEFEATIGIKGIKVEGEQINDEEDPCPRCVEEIEIAKEEVLAKRKKK